MSSSRSSMPQGLDDQNPNIAKRLPNCHKQIKGHVRRRQGVEGLKLRLGLTIIQVDGWEQKFTLGSHLPEAAVHQMWFPLKPPHQLLTMHVHLVASSGMEPLIS